jgi:predicted dehydrogenase
MRTKARIGIIGAGTVARHNQIPAFQTCAEAEVAAVFDRHLDRAEQLCAQFGIPKAYADLDRLLADPDIDSVSICTGNISHEEIALKAMKAGKNVLCEKPMAISVEQARNMQQAAEEAGVIFMMGFVNRFRQEAMLINGMREEGRFGEIYHARCGWLRRRGTPSGWFTEKARSGGGAVLDIGVHVIDLTWYLMGRPKPVSVSGVTHRRIGSYTCRSVKGWESAGEKNGVFDNEEAATALIRFENGASLSVDISWAINGQEEGMFVKLYGDRAGAGVFPPVIYGDENGYLTDSAAAVPQEKGWQGAFERETAHFAHCVITGQKPLSPAEDGLTVQKMLCAIYESAEQGKEIML